MATVRACVLYGFGINCDCETQHAFQSAGAFAERIHVNDLISGGRKLSEFDILAFPGGFSFGDDLGSGKVLGNKFKFNLKGELAQFVADGKLVIGICNGFQSLVKMGLLPGLEGDYFTQRATLTFNDSGKFEDRWVHLKLNPSSKCVWTRGIEGLYLPVRHGEGKFVAGDSVLDELERNGQVVAQYVNASGGIAGYPLNPNGSLRSIAGVCDPEGRIFGLMPHPEAYNHPTNHPRWTRGGVRGVEKHLGLKVFANAVGHAAATKARRAAVVQG
ncbi:phosphoribosylformylglycinamidine synthase I [Candidatus Micrarchaeota archaeon]|nr:phosphoribosylformylglycinamidine synthase I [Candidatus Micrarchaeota archaeon]